MVKAVDLCGIHDDVVEAVEVLVVFPLQVGSGLYFLLCPDMSRRHHQHG